MRHGLKAGVRGADAAGPTRRTGAAPRRPAQPPPGRCHSAAFPHGVAAPHLAAPRQYGFIGACVSKMYSQSRGVSDS